jgi:hypothetical protein
MREEAKPVKLPSAKKLAVLIVFTLLPSATMALLPSFPIDAAQASPAENNVALADWSDRNLSRASPEEVRDAVTRIQYIPGEEGLHFEELEMEPDPKKPPHVSSEKAAEDVERLFYLLENGYSGYGYFSELASFDEAEAAILKGLNRRPVWNRDELSRIIYEHLGFLRDRHLDIGGLDYGGHMDFWCATGFDLREEAGEYVFTSKGAEYAVESINGESPEGHLFPSLNADGEAVYRMGVLSLSPPNPLDLKARSGQETRQWRVKLSRSEPRYASYYEEKTVGGVPVVRIRTFGDHPREYIDGFLASASRFKGAPCLIVDIRGNGGGNEAWPKQWVTRFTGGVPNRVQVFTELISETAMIGRANSYALALHRAPELSQLGYPAKVEEFRGYAESFEEEDLDPYWWPYDVPEPQDIPSETTLVVLMDANVYSSGEGFISYLHQVENVVIVGENSGGAVTYGQMSHHRLPNSQILVALPTSLNVFVDLEYREEKGFLPDIWVPAGDALNYAVAAIRKGTIPTSESYREGLMEAPFIPEEPPAMEKAPLILAVVFTVLYGIVAVYYNRHRKTVFFIGGIIGAPVSYYLLSREPILGYVGFILSLEYLLIGLYKISKQKKKDQG